MEEEKETGEKRERRMAAPICGICGQPKKKGNGFGADYECPYCKQSSGMGFGRG